MTAPRFLVGIDLGTSNCALAFVDTEAGPGAPVTDFPVPQLQALGEISPRSTLPSALYLPHPDEFPAETLRLPWDTTPDMSQVIGHFARSHGARVPGRLVTSAKSWLCHPGVDRSAPILPWGAAPDVPRVSPVDASARYLLHLARAWDQAHPGHPLAEQDLVLTVPASFDVVARNLTVEAAHRAGLRRCTLVEEPQAAFEDFVHTATRNGSLEAALAGIRLVLVVDVGGGTTDFTLVQVEGPVLRRIAVGEHLMLGGDNMDAALARCAEERMSAGGRRLGASSWTQLLQASRDAKERLLGEDAPAEVRLSIAGQGSALMGGTLKATLTRADVERLVLEGFFPACGPEPALVRAPRTALQELGLPYAKDPAIPRQLAAFLHAHRGAGHLALAALAALDPTPSSNAVHPPPVPGSLPRPDAVLLNGGVFKADPLARRLLGILSSWWPDQPPIPTLPHGSLDLAVARGAACHGLARRGLARRIAGGSSHAIYVGLGSDSAGPGSALCVIPRGWEEGRTAELNQRVFRLTLGRPVQFPLFTSTSDRVESPGDLVAVDEELTPLPPLHALLRSEKQADPSARESEIPVHLRATLTEIGTLELACVAQDSAGHWRLEFELRGSGSGSGSASGLNAVPGNNAPVVEAMPRRFDDARQAVEHVFTPRSKSARSTPGSGPTPPAQASLDALAKAARQLPSQLETHLGPRDEWRLPVLRELWGALHAGAARRRRSPDHERAYFQLAGFSLRPGFGYPLDAWRCEQIAPLFAEGVQSVKDATVWDAFWVHWRRIAGGLEPARHREIWEHLRPHLAFRIDPGHPKHSGKPKGTQPEGLHEMVRLAASLEHLAPADKAVLGGWVLAQLELPTGLSGPWAWALGRLGARVPLAGNQHQTLDPEIATRWLERLRHAHARGADGALFALVQIARLTGDRSRDLDDDARTLTLATLEAGRAPASWIRLVREVADLERADEARVLGDSLPVGLKLA